MKTKVFCSKCLKWGCVCWFTGWALGAPFLSDDLELPPEHAPAMVAAMGSSSSATAGSGPNYLVHDEITGDEHSTMFVYKQRALRALRATGPWVLKPEALRQVIGPKVGV
jgi:hypothetical protein